MNAQIFLVEDHEVMRRAIGGLVQNEGFALWGTAATAEEALIQLREAGGNRELPDIILVDLSLPDMTGIQLVRSVNEAFPEISCLILTARRDHTYVHRALAAGARGYLKKDAPEEIGKAMRQILAGGTFIAQDD